MKGGEITRPAVDFLSRSSHSSVSFSGRGGRKETGDKRGERNIQHVLQDRRLNVKT